MGHSEETKAKISETMKKRRAENDWWEGRKHTKETKKKMSRTFLKAWKDEDYARYMGLSQAIRPTKPEIELTKLLDAWFPGQYSYTGDGRLQVCKTNPDFIHKAGKPLIIELFGEYFHEDNEVDTRIQKFAEGGYDCLIIWVKEMEDEEKLKEKITNFTYKERN